MEDSIMVFSTGFCEIFQKSCISRQVWAAATKNTNEKGSQPVITCSTLTLETLQQGVKKYAQSQQ